MFSDFWKGFGHRPWFSRNIEREMMTKGVPPTLENGADCAKFVRIACENTRRNGEVPSAALAASRWVGLYSDSGNFIIRALRAIKEKVR